ncbi:MAG: hypothetical protein R3E68_02585 [Burkholderiaceae bacterium]
MIVDAGGLARQLRPSGARQGTAPASGQLRVSIPLHQDGDNPLWVCVTTEDGFQAWSSPVFVFA